MLKSRRAHAARGALYTWLTVAFFVLILTSCAKQNMDQPSRENQTDTVPAGQAVQEDSITEEESDATYPDWPRLTPQRLVQGRLPQWSPLGHWLSYVDEYERLILSPYESPGAAARVIIPSFETQGEDVYGIGEFAWRPDEQGIIYYLNTAPGSQAAGIFEKPAVGGARQTLYQPQSSTIITDLHVTEMGVHFNLPEENRQQIITESGATPLPSGSLDWSYAPDGSGRLTFRNGQVQWEALGGQNSMPDWQAVLDKIPAQSFSTSEGASWSPDGQALAVFRDHHIWLASAGQAGGREGLPHFKELSLAQDTVVQRIVWSPDGEQIAVLAEKAGLLGYGLWWSGVGSSLAELPALEQISSGPVSGVTWSPDGKVMVYDEGGFLFARSPSEFLLDLSGLENAPDGNQAIETQNSGPSDGRVTADLQGAVDIRVDSSAGKHALEIIGAYFEAQGMPGNAQPEKMYQLADGRIYALVFYSLATSGNAPRVERYEVLLQPKGGSLEVAGAEIWPK